MNTDPKNRLLAKCLEIYERKRWLYPVHQFLQRLGSVERFNGLFDGDFWDESLIPEIKKRYFPDETIDSILEKSMVLYRSNPDRALAIQLVWQEFEWKYPFDSETYSDFVERLDDLLAKESDPPTRADWEYLDECLMK